MEEKKCRHCAMMIPADAKICPFCRKNSSRTFLLLLGIAFAIFLIGTCIATIPETSKKKPASAPDTQIALTEKGQKIKMNHSGWSNDICNTIAEKKIRISMTKDQVAMAWGKPERVNSSTYSWGTDEQWVYGQSYVYFKNGIMTSIQQSK